MVLLRKNGAGKLQRISPSGKLAYGCCCKCQIIRTACDVGSTRQPATNTFCCYKCTDTATVEVGAVSLVGGTEPFQQAAEIFASFAGSSFTLDLKDTNFEGTGDFGWRYIHQPQKVDESGYAYGFELDIRMTAGGTYENEVIWGVQLYLSRVPFSDFYAGGTCNLQEYEFAAQPPIGVPIGTCCGSDGYDLNITSSDYFTSIAITSITSNSAQTTLCDCESFPDTVAFVTGSISLAINKYGNDPKRCQWSYQPTSGACPYTTYSISIERRDCGWIIFLQTFEYELNEDDECVMVNSESATFEKLDDDDALGNYTRTDGTAGGSGATVS